MRLPHVLRCCLCRPPPPATPATSPATSSADVEKVEVQALGGLHVVGTERHESRRIDNQLRGRAGRQGDAGSTRYFLSLEVGWRGRVCASLPACARPPAPPAPHLYPTLPSSRLPSPPCAALATSPMHTPVQPLTHPHPLLSAHRTICSASLAATASRA